MTTDLTPPTLPLAARADMLVDELFHPVAQKSLPFRKVKVQASTPCPAAPVSGAKSG